MCFLYTFHKGFEHKKVKSLSGGEKQRVAIARALIKNASILILDDSVSAVDTKTEKIILDNLRATRKGKTTILIAHRISTIEKVVNFLDQTKKPIFENLMDKHMEFINNIIKSVPVYELTCDISKEAVDLVKNTIFTEDK